MHVKLELMKQWIRDEIDGAIDFCGSVLVS